jgi:adenosylcobinamide kinase / adenosylcobinamide-phosphate guanylyltransferase
MEDTAAVDVCLLGTGGADGWPQPGCTCASCGRIRAAGDTRAPGRVLVGGVLEVSPGRPPTAVGARAGGARAGRASAGGGASAGGALAAESEQTVLVVAGKVTALPS